LRQCNELLDQLSPLQQQQQNKNKNKTKTIVTIRSHATRSSHLHLIRQSIVFVFMTTVLSNNKHIAAQPTNNGDQVKQNCLQRQVGIIPTPTDRLCRCVSATMTHSSTPRPIAAANQMSRPALHQHNHQRHLVSATCPVKPRRQPTLSLVDLVNTLYQQRHPVSHTFYTNYDNQLSLSS
jgi:hypothetical protein